ncbi:hypothetical protein GGR51DRAFT_561046 [Nemania sp. FL0031]|nr:hypothetical protein GGR51DRAFT_561046 [Nemania sp. FL0031]
MASSRNYDRTTGQMFHQWDVPAPTATEPWHRVRTPLRRLKKPLPLPSLHHRGPAPLVDMCLKVAVKHIEEIDEVYLQYFPSRLMGKLWEYTKQTGMLSVATWKLLIRLAQDKEIARYVFPLLMRHSTWAIKMQPLAAYMEHLASDSFDFLTHLTITGTIGCSQPELLQLVNLKNLAVLEIIQPPDDERHTGAPIAPIQLTDSIVREWSTSPDPFPFLRVLRVWGDDHTTIRSLRYISAFPSLVIYDVAGRKRDWAQKGGNPVWKSRYKTWRTDLNDTLSAHFCFLQYGIPDGQLTEELQSGAYFHVADLIRAISKDETELAPFQKHVQRAYQEICMDSRGLHLPVALQCMCFPCPEPSKWPEHNGLWGFLMYCQIGKILSDRDLLAQGLDIGERAFAPNTVDFPPRPMLNLVLGEAPNNSGNRRESLRRDSCEHVHTFGRTPLHSPGFETQITFVRDSRHRGEREAPKSTMVGGETNKRAPETSTTTHRPHKKRQGVSDILDSFQKG